MNLKKSLSFLAALALLATTDTALIAQTASGETPLLDKRYDNWYQIELIIFDRPNTQTAYNAEAWPNNISLFYPGKVDFLFTPEEWESFNAPDSLDSDEYNSEPLPAQEQSANYQNTQLSIKDPSEMETPRIKLNNDEKSLIKEKNQLQRRRGYRVLFHEAWRQELSPIKNSTSIVITGGDKIEEHFELEGSIMLSLSRFLHLETNLWRSFFVPNYGQELPYWPALPLLPQPTKNEMRDGYALNGKDQNLFTADTQPSNFDLEAGFNQPSTTMNLALDSGFNNTSLPRVGDDFNIRSVNLVKEIITLKQKRRMRSQELHYIDHPRLGVIIKISPYEVALPAPSAETYENEMPTSDLMNP